MRTKNLIATACTCLGFCLVAGTARSEQASGWVEISRSDGYAPSPEPDHLPIHAPNVGDGPSASGMVGASAHLLDAESYTCAAGAEAWDPDDDVFAEVWFYRDNVLVDHGYGFGYSPVAVATTSVTRADTSTQLRCDAAWSGGNGSAYYTVEPIPTGEDTIPMGWYFGETTYQYDMQLTGNGPFTGRRVKEEDGGGGSDSCWRSGPPSPKLDRVSGGNWPVGNQNMWGPDLVGWGSGAVGWYRANSPIPCGCHMVQRMLINAHTPGGHEEWFWYKTNHLYAGIAATTVWAERDGVRREKPWQ